MDALAILLGWPSLVLALLLAGTGAWRRKRWPLIAAFVLALPTTLYIAFSPGHLLAALAPLSALAIAAARCRRAPRWQSLAGVVVYAMFLIWLLLLVRNDP